MEQQGSCSFCFTEQGHRPLRSALMTNSARLTGRTACRVYTRNAAGCRNHRKQALKYAYKGPDPLCKTHFSGK